MDNQNDERERLIRLRQRQLQARDPRATDKRVIRTTTRRQRKRVKRVTLGEMVRGIPHKWRGFIIGALIGMVLSILLPLFMEGVLIEVVGILAIVILAGMGLAVGQALDVRDELRDFSRRK